MAQDRSTTRDFVGRGTELTDLEQAITSARGAVPSVVLVGGDAGIGKSTLLAEATARAGVPLLLGRCVAVGGDVIALAPLADLLRRVRRSAPSALDEAEGAVALAHWLSPTSAGLGEGPPAGNLFMPVLDLVAHLARDEAVVVGFEDLHWADVATWDLFEFLARNLVDEKVVLVGSYRANEITTRPTQRRRLAELARHPIVRQIHLRGLDPGEVAARVSSLLGGAAEAALIDQVVARGQGNPFFTEQLVAAHLAGDAIPAVLSDLISADIAELDERTREVMGAVAVVGRGTSHQLLAHVAALEDEEAEDAVRSAIDAQMLVVDDTGDYWFRHALIAEVAYGELLPPQRSRLHRRVADALRGQSTDDLRRADRVGELAFHLDRAGERGDAFGALLAASDAAEIIAPGAALGHLERALELWDEVGQHVGAEDRGARMWQAAELASAAIGNERAVELARAALAVGPPPQGWARAHERLGRYLWSAGRLDESRSEFEQARSILRPDDPDAGSVFAGLGQAALMAGDFDAAEEWCRRTFHVVATPSDDAFSWVMACRVQAVVCSTRGETDRALALGREAVAGAPTAQARALAVLYLCVVLLDAGLDDEAISVALDAVAINHTAGLDRSFGGYTDALAAEGLVRLGRWAEAEALLARHATYDTLPVGALRVARSAALLAARRGDADRARQLLSDARSFSVEGWHRTYLHLTAAEVHLTIGDWSEAANAAEDGASSSTGAEPLMAARFAMIATASAVEQALDDQAGGRTVDLPARGVGLQERIDRLRRAAKSDVGDGLAPDIAAHLAHATASLTRLTGADPDAWAEAARRWTESGDVWWAAVAMLHEGDAAATVGAADRASSCLRGAHQAASAMGSPSLLVQVEAVSRRTRISVAVPDPVPLPTTSAHGLGLTPRENEVLAHLASGRTNRQIGDELFVSEKTVSVHVSNILRKLGVASRFDAAAIAQRLGQG